MFGPFLRRFIASTQGHGGEAIVLGLLVLALPVYGQKEEDPTGACCLGALYAGCSVQTQADCTGAHGDYLGNGIACSPYPCQGACCKAGGGCVMVPRGPCALSFGGVFTGYASCESTTCPEVGACCLGDGCVNTTREDCALRGEFVGGTACSETACTGVCCLEAWDAACSLTRSECEAAPYFGDFAGVGSRCTDELPCASICCHFDGSCEWTPFHAALECPQPGFYAGFGAYDTGCATADCGSLKFGACCAQEACSLRTPETCRAGEYLGDNVQCLRAGEGSGAVDCPSPCASDEDCDDGNFCTVEWCGPHGYCENEEFSCPEFHDCSPALGRCKCYTFPPTSQKYDFLLDLVDWKAIAACLKGPDVVVTPECDCTDGYRDNVVDLRDVRETQRYFRP